MSASGRPVRQIVEGIVSRDLSPAARGRAAADFARRILREGQETNRRATGHETPYVQIVDGTTGKPLEQVNTDSGRIIFRFDVAKNELFVWIAEQLSFHAPRITGEYEASFRLFAGDRQIAAGEDLPRADEYVFVSTVPYARRLERHYAPEGIFQAVAVLAANRFKDVAYVRFSYRPMSEFGIGEAASKAVRTSRGARQTERAARTPAIVVRLI